MPAPIGSDSHDVRIWDCQEASGTTLANEGADTGHDLSISSSGNGLTPGVTGLGPGGLAVDCLVAGTSGAWCETADETGPSLSGGYSISCLVRPTGINNPFSTGYTYGPIFGKAYNHIWSYPYEAVGLYWNGSNKTDYSWIVNHADSGGTSHHLISSDYGLNAIQNHWCLLWQTWNGTTLTMGMHYINDSGVVVFAGSHSISVSTLGLGTGPWYGPGFLHNTSWDRSILGQYSRMRVRNQAESASFFADLLALYRDGGVAPAPTITSVSPLGGVAGASVDVVGTDFVTGAVVDFGGVAAVTTFVSSTHLTAIAPAHALGVVDVTVTNPDTQSDTLAAAFAYAAGVPSSSAAVDSGGGVARDLMLGPDGDLLVQDQDLQLSRGHVSILQDAEAALRMFQGEWFLDTSKGVPYLQEVLTKGVKTDRLRNIFREALLSVQGIAEVTELRLSYEPAHRRLGVVFQARDDVGALLPRTTVELTQ